MTNTDEKPSESQKNIAINFFKATKLNEKDLEDIPVDIKKDIKFYFVNNYSEIYDKVFK